MLCANCGREFDDTLAECPHCHGGKEAADWPERMREKMAEDARVTPSADARKLTRLKPIILAVLAMMLCCAPIGVVAVAYAVMANGSASVGRYRDAWILGDKAASWFWLTVMCGIVTWAVILFWFGWPPWSRLHL
jgi:hypothetical protein